MTEPSNTALIPGLTQFLRLDDITAFLTC